MLRVAAVASIIADSYKKDLDRETLITVCLLHDIGSIIKFDLKTTYEINSNAFKDRSLEYWEKVKEDYIKKYGPDEFEANLKILRGLGTSRRVYEISEIFEFSDSKSIYESKNLERIIAKYADLRVTPYGVGSLEDRMKDVEKRYVIQRQKWTKEELDELSSYWYRAEGEIFASCKIRPEEITNENVSPMLESLRNFEIATK